MLQYNLCVTINNDSVAIWVSQARTQLCQVTESQISFKSVWCHAERSRWICMRSGVKSRACVIFNCVLISNVISQPLPSCISGDHRPHTRSSKPHRMTLKPWISKLFWILLTWRNCTFAWPTRIATESLLIITHQWYCTSGRQDVELSKIWVRWPNTSYFLI